MHGAPDSPQGICTYYPGYGKVYLYWKHGFKRAQIMTPWHVIQVCFAGILFFPVPGPWINDDFNGCPDSSGGFKINIFFLWPLEMNLSFFVDGDLSSHPWRYWRRAKFGECEVNTISSKASEISIMARLFLRLHIVIAYRYHRIIFFLYQWKQSQI